MADWWAENARARERRLPVPGSERWARRRGCFAGRDVDDPFQTGRCAEAADPGFSDRNPRCSACSPDPITSDHQSCVSLPRGSSGRTTDTRRGRTSLPTEASVIGHSTGHRLARRWQLCSKFQIFSMATITASRPRSPEPPRHAILLWDLQAIPGMAHVRPCNRLRRLCTLSRRSSTRRRHFPRPPFRRCRSVRPVHRRVNSRFLAAIAAPQGRCDPHG
jgi:hypothetical protein